MPLFAEVFLTPLLEPEGSEPVLRYDEQRSLNVLEDGRPFVETGSSARTSTITEVQAEQDDFDRPDEDDGQPGLGTMTHVSRERDDFAGPVLATETRQAPGEQDDFARSDAELGTQTAIGREADDFVRAMHQPVSASDLHG